MKTNNTLVLLRTMVISSSISNIYRHCKDKKKRGKILGGFIGMAVLYLFMIAYFIAQAVVVGQNGFLNEIPSLTATSVMAMAFLLCIFRASAYLFRFKEYDMLMAMPFEVSQIVQCKFLHMYIKMLPWFFTISVAMLIGYGVVGKPAFYVYPVWLLLSLVLPVIPMVVASFFSALIARVSALFRYKKMVQTVFMFIFILLCFFSRFIIEAVIREDKMTETVETLVSVNGSIKSKLFLTDFFEKAVLEGKWLYGVLLIVITVVVFSVFYLIVSKMYRRINSSMGEHTALRNYQMTTLKSQSIKKSIAMKELRRMTGSTNYMVNAGFGIIMVVIATIAALFINADQIIQTMLQGAPITKEMLLPAIPFLVYMFVGMVPTTCCSPSLEGKNYWIVQSLPITKMDLYKGKMLFQLWLSIPASVLGTLVLSLRFGAGFIEALILVLESVVLCLFCTVFGLVCGIKFMRLDWENEIEIIKQSTAVVAYLFPNLIATMGLIVGSVALGLSIGTVTVTVLGILVVAVLASICYFIVRKMIGYQDIKIRNQID